MLTLIKNATVYSPKPLGKKDILIGGEKILELVDSIELNSNLKVEVIDAEDYLLVPGFIDS
ncbi:MAG: beta-aspartyl-peptidase, partial [Thermotogota bacterium]|nr:beta-aspartyl-peptidase [Thermotogota bacterium]